MPFSLNKQAAVNYLWMSFKSLTLELKTPEHRSIINPTAARGGRSIERFVHLWLAVNVRNMARLTHRLSQTYCIYSFHLEQSMWVTLIYSENTIFYREKKRRAPAEEYRLLFRRIQSRLVLRKDVLVFIHSSSSCVAFSWTQKHIQSLFDSHLIKI